MQTQQTPQVLEQPFAAQGDKNTIPNAATGTNKASLQEGFPPITGQPINKGGVPPERQDFNGAMNLNSQFYFAFQNGWWPTFTQEVSDAIGGYPQGAVLWLFDTENKVYTPLLSLVGNNTYNFNTNKDYIGQYWAKILPDSGRGLPLGAVYFSSSSNADDNPGALPLWSGAYYTNASTLYPAFYAWVKSHTELCKSKTEYDSAISTYGECPFYVVDEVAGSLRLPKLVNYLKMANATDGITQSGAGLPDHSHAISQTLYSEAGNTVNHIASGGPNADSTLNISTGNASNSNSIYGASDTVTPAHTTVFPWVVSTASDAESSAAAAAQSADAAAASATAAASSASAAAQSAQDAASSASLADIQNKITNCLTKIPQDINLQLSNGTLTLKSGSTVYRGNGQAINITQDITMNYTSSATILVCANVSGTALQGRPIANCSAGTSDPQTPNTIYYDTSNNVINFYTSGGAQSEVSFPIAICTATGQISSIDQVFNGFGFIGSTLFALPGIGCLIPNGRNADGTLKNTQVSVSSIRTLSFSAAKETAFGLTATSLYETADSIYNSTDNKNYSQTGNFLGYCPCGTLSADSSGKITALSAEMPFHGLDYNYFSDFVSKMDYVVDSYSDESGNWYRLYKSGWVEQGGLMANAGGLITVNLLKSMANINYYVSMQLYSASESTDPGYWIISNKSTTSFKINATNKNGILWYACGQGA